MSVAAFHARAALPSKHLRATAGREGNGSWVVFARCGSSGVFLGFLAEAEAVAWLDAWAAGCGAVDVGAEMRSPP